MLHLSGNDADDNDIPGLSSSDESEGEDEVPAHWILGDFPWGRTKCSQKSYRQQVLWWCQLPRHYRDQSFASMKRLLMAPFLFQHALIPQKWIRWAGQLDMIKYDAAKQQLPDVEISRQHYLSVRMIEIALDRVEVLSQKTKSAIGVLKAMYEIKEKSCTQLEAALRDSRFDIGIKSITNAIEDNMKNIASGSGPTKVSDKEYLSNQDRFVLAGMLCCRQFAETLCIIACEGRDFAQEMDWQYGEETFEGLSEKLDRIRGQGNSLYTSGEYQSAYDMYTIAIRMSPFYSVLYSNRCQASIKLGNFMSAFCDAYRAVVLTPQWAKAYYKMMTCLKKLGYHHDAVAWGKIGVRKARDSAEFSELEALYKKYVSQKKEEIKAEEAAAAPVSSSTATKPLTQSGAAHRPHSNASANRKKSKNKKKKKKTSEPVPKPPKDEDEDVPELVSDGSEWDGDEKRPGSTRSAARTKSRSPDGLKPPPAKTSEKSNEDKSQKSIEPAKEQAKSNGEKVEAEKKKQKQTVPEDQAKVLNSKDETQKVKKNVTDGEKRKDAEEERRRIREEGELEEKKTKDIQIQYDQFVEKGSMALMASHFTNATRMYSSAIELITEKKTIRGVHNDDFMLLLYARGVASLRQMIPMEIDASAKFFQRIISDAKTFGHISMVYFRLGKATYLLNEFDTAIHHTYKGLQIIKKSPPTGRLPWPGTNETIPESDERHLTQEMKFLLQQCKIPPPPTAVCIYETCKRDYSRKRIYSTDVDFEGYFVIRCDWKCNLCYHLKCWARCKHDKLKLHGDKDVLGINCFTPDCRGVIVSIKMVDAAGVEKNAKEKSPTVKPTPARQNKYDRRTPKSYHNLMRYRRVQAEKRQKRKDRRKQKTENNETKARNKEQKNKNENIPADQDLSEATIYMKTNGENLENRVRGVDTKSRTRTNRKLVPVSLQRFCSSLPGYRQDMSMHDIADAIEKAKEDGTPFHLPADLQEEIEEFEATLRGETPDRLFDDDERMKVAFLFEYFQDFFKAKGPVKTSDELFTSQIELLPEDINNIIAKAGGLVPFLSSSPLFIIDPPYVGILSQQQTIRSLIDPEMYQHERDTSSRSSSIDLSLNGFLSGNGLSQFAKDFYHVGAPVEDIDIPGLTGGQQLPSPFSASNGFEKFNGQLSETSSMMSLEDDLKSESGSHVSFDMDKNLFKRPPTPVKKQKTPATAASTSRKHVEDTAKKPKKQPLPISAEVSTQTEGRDEAEKAKEEVERLLERIMGMEDAMTKLKRTSKLREETFQTEIQEARDAEKAALEKAQQATHDKDTEIAKISQQKKKMADKLQAAKEKEKQSQQMEEQARTELMNLGSGMREDRENLLQEILSARRTNEELQSKLAAGLNRATKAEIDLVKANEMFVIMPHMQAKAESEKCMNEIEQHLYSHGSRMQEWMIRRLQEGKTHWMNNVVLCQKTIETLKAGFASIQTQVSNGRPLSELPSVPELKPPPPGPSLRKIMTQPHMGPQPSGSGDGLGSRHGPIGSGVPQSSMNLHHQLNRQSPHHNGRESPFQGGNSMQKMQKKKNFQQLIQKLSRSIPEVPVEQLESYAQHVRAENGGLTGLLYDEIEQRIRLMLHRSSQAQASNGHPGNPSISPIQRYQASAAPWAGLTSSASASNKEVKEMDSFDDEDSVCPICCDPLKDGRVHTLDCDHKFHFDCISKWMQKQRTCPNCRKFMADSGEFPPLSGVPPGLLQQWS